MKAKLFIAVLITGLSLDAAGMGHPHNIFAARKRIKAKQLSGVQQPCACSPQAKTLLFAKATITTTATIWSWIKEKEAN